VKIDLSPDEQCATVGPTKPSLCMPESGFAIKDLAGLSEPAGKLIEAVRAATGVLYEPTRIRRTARAEADAAMVKAKSDIEVKELEERAFKRVKAREARRQENLEVILGEATQNLPPQVGTQTLDEDWVAEFTNACQDICDKKMQQLWSRVLSGEFVSPGQYSLRTLATIKLLSKRDAEMFTSLCSYLWKTGDGYVYFRTHETDSFLTNFGFPYRYFLHLGSLGLLVPDKSLVVEFGEMPSSRMNIVFHYHGEPYAFKTENPFVKHQVPCISLTDIGNELVSLCTSKPSDGYLEALIESFKVRHGVEMIYIHRQSADPAS